MQRGEAKRLYIEMKFSMRDCSLSPDVVRSCKETFDLRYFETGKDKCKDKCKEKCKDKCKDK